MEKLFGTDGIRGKANQFPITPEMVLKIGQAIGIYFRARHSSPRILIGKDTRRSGYMLEQALSAGICSVGVDVNYLGPLPTPGIAYLTRGMRACAGIVISASHNPYDDNGIKVFNHDGYKLPDQDEAELERIIAREQIIDNMPLGMSIGRARRIDDAIGQYAVFLKEQFPKHFTLEGLRVVIDCANGASYKVAPKVFSELGAEVFTIGVEPNGRNINDGCGALHPENLREKVLLYKANIGLGFDGDADRIVVVDDKGQVCDGDYLMAICGIKLLRESKLRDSTVVSTIMSNMGLDAAIEGAGGRVIRTKVGDRYVVEEMRKGNFILGGEQSGHIIFRDSSTTGDGLLAALKLLEVIVESGRPLSELRKPIIMFPQVRRDVHVQQKIPTERLPKLSKKLEQVQKELGKKGRVLFRYSGTENLARIMLEGENYDRITSLCTELAEIAEREIAAESGAK
jgi:phosphoglucosamine mutase